MCFDFRLSQLFKTFGCLALILMGWFIDLLIFGCRRVILCFMWTSVKKCFHFVCEGILWCLLTTDSTASYSRRQDHERRNLHLITCSLAGDFVTFIHLSFIYATSFFVAMFRSQVTTLSSRGDLLIPRTRTRTADSAFVVAGPSAWNALPSDLRAITTKTAFHNHLKTHLFSN